MDEVTIRNDSLFIEEVNVDVSGKTDIIDTCEVPVIHIGTSDKEVCNKVQYVKIEPDGMSKYNNGIVTLIDGTQWFKIPISEVEVQNAESDENVEVVQVDEPDHGEESTLTDQIVFLDDGSIAYVQPVYSEESNDNELENYEVKVESEEENYKTVKKPKGRKHICPVVGCFRTYTSLHHLKVHSRNHTGDRPYKCLIEGCLKAFATDYSRKAHIRTHTGEKPYICPSAYCSKGFKTSGDLQKHIRVHTGERPFVCPIKGCNRSFTTSNIRKVHIRTHTGEKPYVCTQDGCSRRFASSTNFKNHMRIHSGEKPYVCTVDGCLKRFTEYSSLYKHQLVHSQVKKHSCPFCHKTYRQSSTLTTHKRTVHGVISADDGTEIILEQMIGLGEDGSKNFKNITSKLLNLKKAHGTVLTMEDDCIGSSPLYIVSQMSEEDFDEVEAVLAE